jgi:hypothetical protein
MFTIDLTKEHMNIPMMSFLKHMSSTKRKKKFSCYKEIRSPIGSLTGEDKHPPTPPAQVTEFTLSNFIERFHKFTDDLFRSQAFVSVEDLFWDNFCIAGGSITYAVDPLAPAPEPTSDVDCFYLHGYEHERSVLSEDPRNKFHDIRQSIHEALCYSVRKDNLERNRASDLFPVTIDEIGNVETLYNVHIQYNPRILQLVYYDCSSRKDDSMRKPRSHKQEAKAPPRQNDNEQKKRKLQSKAADKVDQTVRKLLLNFDMSHVRWAITKKNGIYRLHTRRRTFYELFSNSRRSLPNNEQCLRTSRIVKALQRGYHFFYQPSSLSVTHPDYFPLESLQDLSTEFLQNEFNKSNVQQAAEKKLIYHQLHLAPTRCMNFECRPSPYVPPDAQHRPCLSVVTPPLLIKNIRGDRQNITKDGAWVMANELRIDCYVPSDRIWGDKVFKLFSQRNEERIISFNIFVCDSDCLDDMNRFVAECRAYEDVSNSPELRVQCILRSDVRIFIQLYFRNYYASCSRGARDMWHDDLFQKVSNIKFTLDPMYRRYLARFLQISLRGFQPHILGYLSKFRDT